MAHPASKDGFSHKMTIYIRKKPLGSTCVQEFDAPSLTLPGPMQTKRYSQGISKTLIDGCEITKA